MPDYVAHATTIGGRKGHVETSDGLLKADLSILKSIGAPRRDGTSNPEQFFAAGYSACFGGSVEYAAYLEKVKAGKVTVTADVTLTVDDSGYNLGNCSPHLSSPSGIPSFRERPDFGAFRPSRRANGEP